MGRAGDAGHPSSRLALPALERLGMVLVGDVAVPVPRLAEMRGRVAAVAGEYRPTLATVAHAGDGNLPPLVVFDGNDAAAERRAVAIYEQLMGEALELGGTITGEHGVGTVKREFLPRQLGPGPLAVHRAIKAALDPAGILNPGKMIASS